MNLLPCPFCGGVASIRGSRNFTVTCNTCFSTTQTFSSWLGNERSLIGGYDILNLKKYREKAIDAWNTRVKK